MWEEGVREVWEEVWEDPGVMYILSLVADPVCPLLCSEQLVRRGFQALQLIISDYLPALPTSEVPLCIVVTTKFALQQVDINISLTAVGLLWTVADHLFHSKVAMAVSPHKGSSKMSPLPSDVVAKIPNVATPPILSPFLKSGQSPAPQLANRLWLLLFACLSDLCADPRAAVRKSASQTLFSTVTAHGTVLEDQSWGVVLWMVSTSCREGHTAALACQPSFLPSLLSPRSCFHCWSWSERGLSLPLLSICTPLSSSTTHATPLRSSGRSPR